MKRCALCGKSLFKKGITYSKGELQFCSQSCVRENEDRQAGRSSYCAICGKKATGGGYDLLKMGLLFADMTA